MVDGTMSWRVTTELVWELRNGTHASEIGKAVAVMHQVLHEQDAVSEVFVSADDEGVVLTALVDVAAYPDPPVITAPRVSPPAPRLDPHSEETTP